MFVACCCSFFISHSAQYTVHLEHLAQLTVTVCLYHFTCSASACDVAAIQRSALTSCFLPFSCVWYDVRCISKFKCKATFFILLLYCCFVYIVLKDKSFFNWLRIFTYVVYSLEEIAIIFLVVKLMIPANGEGSEN